jgi:cytochrome subunit of sulfide dehydrogenase
MKSRHYYRFLIVLLLTSVCLPITGSAAEVLVSVADQANTTHIRTHIRTLAASCAACHGSNGNSIGNMPRLAGIDGKYFVAQMLAFKSGSRPATVMQHHAKGLNEDEINLLAAHFSQQKPVRNTPVKSQTLKADHDN